MNMRKTLITTILLSVSAFRISHAQPASSFYIAPSFDVGYTFAGGISFGFAIDMGLWRSYLAPERELNTGFSFTHYWTKAYRDRFHTITAINFLTESDYYDIKLGFGNVVDRHGYNKIVHCRAAGFYTDISFTDNEIYFPWIGMKGFWYNWNKFEGFEYPYITPFIKYKYDVFQQSGIKNYN
ncbi:MAG: hypothetical protein ACHQFW_04995 [Chitinophagales bacterium]